MNKSIQAHAFHLVEPSPCVNNFNKNYSKNKSDLNTNNNSSGLNLIILNSRGKLLAPLHFTPPPGFMVI